MTDEQIKQNAKAYAVEETACNSCQRYCERGFIAGAHSRDEEIASLQNQIEELSEQLKKMNAENIQKLRNPWISVKDRLPEIGDIVLTKIENIVKCGEEYEKTEHPLVQVYNGRWGTDRCEQHRMGGKLYDCISKVTHWMPIPQIKSE